MPCPWELRLSPCPPSEDPDPWRRPQMTMGHRIRPGPSPPVEWGICKQMSSGPGKRWKNQDTASGHSTQTQSGPGTTQACP